MKMSEIKKKGVEERGGYDCVTSGVLSLGVDEELLDVSDLLRHFDLSLLLGVCEGV